VTAEALRDQVASIVPALAGARVSLAHSGIRAHVASNDFIIRQDAPGWVNCVGIDSPGLTASISIARKAADLVSR
jgi:glycerol-3-phosphate dehydrogenase